MRPGALTTTQRAKQTLSTCALIAGFASAASAQEVDFSGRFLQEAPNITNASDTAYLAAELVYSF